MLSVIALGPNPLGEAADMRRTIYLLRRMPHVELPSLLKIIYDSIAHLLFPTLNLSRSLTGNSAL
jgi:hypothetical protein